MKQTTPVCASVFMGIWSRRGSTRTLSAMRFFIVIPVLVLLMKDLVAGESPPKLHKEAGIVFMGAYEPPAPRNWGSIPEPAKSRIITHLKNRLGDAFYAKLSLVGGQIIDFKALREKQPDSKDYKWEVPAYRLHLRFSRPEIGIEYYDACIECRSDGSVIQEIDLPEITRHPDRAQFISTTEAFRIAKKQGFNIARATVEIDYRTDLGVCVFTFRQMTRQVGARLFFKCIDIDAHSGKVAKKYDSEAIE